MLKAIVLVGLMVGSLVVLSPPTGACTPVPQCIVWDYELGIELDEDGDIVDDWSVGSPSQAVDCPNGAGNPVLDATTPTLDQRTLRIGKQDLSELAMYLAEQDDGFVRERVWVCGDGSLTGLVSPPSNCSALISFIWVGCGATCQQGDQVNAYTLGGVFVRAAGSCGGPDHTCAQNELVLVAECTTPAWSYTQSGQGGCEHIALPLVDYDCDIV